MRNALPAVSGPRRSRRFADVTSTDYVPALLERSRARAAADGLIGQMFKMIGRLVPPPAGAPSPALWGTREGLARLFGPGAARIEATERDFVFRYRSPQHFVQVFRDWYGPVLKAFAALDAARQAELEADMLALLSRFNRATDGTLAAPTAYLEVVVTRA